MRVLHIEMIWFAKLAKDQIQDSTLENTGNELPRENNLKYVEIWIVTADKEAAQHLQLEGSQKKEH